MVARPPVALTAASWDTLARNYFVDGVRGVIHSVFDRALNLRAEDGELIGLVGPGAGNGPATVVLATLPTQSFPSSGLAPGQAWAVEGHSLIVGASLIVDLATAGCWIVGAREWTATVADVLAGVRRAEQVAGAAAPAGGLAALLPQIEQLAAECLAAADAGAAPSASRAETATVTTGGDAVPRDPVARRALSATADLLRGWLAGDRGRVEIAASRLSGLGPGLTPSGDDLLAGFLVGVAQPGGQPDPALAEAIAMATRERTTDVAAARVRHAARGLIEERLEDVLTVLLTGDSAGLEPAVARAATWGHTSGVDTLVGLFLGLRLGLTPHLPLPDSGNEDVGSPTSDCVGEGRGPLLPGQSALA